LHAGGFETVDECEELALQPHQLGACLAEASVLLRQLPHGGEGFGGRGDIPRAALAAIGEDRAGVEFAVGAAAVGFSAAAAQGVEGTGEERFAGEKDFQEFGELLLYGQELGTQEAEVVGHGSVSGVEGGYL